jgi:hypothetical protein
VHFATIMNQPTPAENMQITQALKYLLPSDKMSEFGSDSDV